MLVVRNRQEIDVRPERAGDSFALIYSQKFAWVYQ